jgi:hypothetical protein
MQSNLEYGGDGNCDKYLVKCIKIVVPCHKHIQQTLSVIILYLHVSNVPLGYPLYCTFFQHIFWNNLLFLGLF